MSERQDKEGEPDELLLLPTEYGGLGLDFSYSMAVAEELGYIRCGGVPMAIGVQTDMATPALARLEAAPKLSPHTFQMQVKLCVFFFFFAQVRLRGAEAAVPPPHHRRGRGGLSWSQ